jgi:tryptophan synthase beta chain
MRRVIYKACTDEQAIQAFMTLSKREGIIPALESAHAISYGMKLAKNMRSTEKIVITLSGRGDKDVEIVQKYIEK